MHAFDPESQRISYRIDEAVAATGISKTQLYREIQAGRLPARKLGRLTLLPADGFKAWLASLPLMAA